MPTDMQGRLFRITMGLCFTRLPRKPSWGNDWKSQSIWVHQKKQKTKKYPKCCVISASLRKAKLQNWSLRNSWCQVSCQCTVSAVLVRGIFFTEGIFHNANNLSIQIRRGYCSFSFTRDLDWWVYISLPTENESERYQARTEATLRSRDSIQPYVCCCSEPKTKYTYCFISFIVTNTFCAWINFIWAFGTRDVVIAPG